MTICAGFHQIVTFSRCSKNDVKLRYKSQVILPKFQNLLSPHGNQVSFDQIEQKTLDGRSFVGATHCFSLSPHTNCFLDLHDSFCIQFLEKISSVTFRKIEIGRAHV